MILDARFATTDLVSAESAGGGEISATAFLITFEK